MKKTFTHSFRAIAAGCLMMLAQGVSATTYTTIASGNWSLPATWNANGVPPNPLPSDGIINSIGYEVTLDVSVTINGIMTTNGFIIISTAVTLTNNGTWTMNPSGASLVGALINNGVIDLKDWISISGTGTFTNTGTIKGTGNINIGSGTFTNTGFIAPGNSPGTLRASGTLSLGSGTYQCEINGTIAGDEYDVLANQGTTTITITGSSLLNIVFGYTAVVDDFFDIILVTTVSGTFASGNISFSGGNVDAISVTYPDGDKVRVTVSALLPVELVSFSGRETASSVQLDWRTASELNNDGFEAQRSIDGEEWEKLAFVPGHGTTTETHDYSFLDKKPLPGTNYYRLRQVDFDGGEEYSKVVSVKVGSPTNSLTFFPNPAPEGITSLYFPEAPEGEGLLEVFDWLGNKVHRQAVLLEGGSDVLVPVDLHSFPSGMYVATLEMGGKVFSEKLVLKR